MLTMLQCVYPLVFLESFIVPTTTNNFTCLHFPRGKINFPCRSSCNKFTMRGHSRIVRQYSPCSQLCLRGLIASLVEDAS